ncbi:MAG: CDP-diacylglycerol--glycerol-3-phosphate 3-phosphatidyltransferase [Chlorobi bacterium]|nr:CDP-diacylglycerol--glycerol-3-phosphate 3-phosphatidyltransferase [Chlorobiota bacterium]
MQPTLNIPNAITASRILLTPLFLWLLLSNDAMLVQIAAGIFLIAAVSDWYDGWYARRYNAMSPFGAFFDPLADKIFIGAAFFAFVALGVLELWMVIIITGRDILTTVLRVIADRKGNPVVTSRTARWKTAIQLIFLWYIVGAWTLNNVDYLRESIRQDYVAGFLAPAIVDPVMLLLVALSIFTAIHYLIEYHHVRRIPGKRGKVAGTPS